MCGDWRSVGGGGCARHLPSAPVQCGCGGVAADHGQGWASARGPRRQCSASPVRVGGAAPRPPVRQRYRSVGCGFQPGGGRGPRDVGVSPLGGDCDCFSDRGRRRWGCRFDLSARPATAGMAVAARARTFRPRRRWGTTAVTSRLCRPTVCARAARGLGRRGIAAAVFFFFRGCRGPAVLSGRLTNSLVGVWLCAHVGSFFFSPSAVGSRQRSCVPGGVCSAGLTLDWGGSTPHTWALCPGGVPARGGGPPRAPRVPLHRCRAPPPK